MFSPNVKVGYDVTKVVNAGFEYYGSVGPVTGFDPLREQQQQLFAVTDLNFSPNLGVQFRCGSRNDWSDGSFVSKNDYWPAVWRTQELNRSVLAGLAILALVAYVPALAQPFLEDDYPNLVLALHFGPTSSWPTLISDPVFRLRATSYLMMYGLHRLFGMHSTGYYAAMILLHIANTWLVYSLGVWRMLGYRLTAWAAGFFAVYEGHQEAVMWVSASNEPLMVLFGLGCIISWICFLDRGGWLWYAASLLAFGGALISKESGIIVWALIALPLAYGHHHKVPFLLPFAALSSLAAVSVLGARASSFRFHDGSFSLTAPFWITWPASMAALFWFWGFLCLLVILAWRPPRYRKILAIGMAWAGTSMIPYSFLTYSHRIPSRQIYLASVGLAIIVGYGLLIFYERYWSTHRALVITVCGLMVAENIAYLWTKKRSQFLERAAPTEQLIAVARASKGPIYVKCFPRPPIVADSAVELTVPGRTLLWTEEEARHRPDAVTFCYIPGDKTPPP